MGHSPLPANNAFALLQCWQPAVEKIRIFIPSFYKIFQEGTASLPHGSPSPVVRNNYPTGMALSLTKRSFSSIRSCPAVAANAVFSDHLQLASHLNWVRLEVDRFNPDQKGKTFSSATPVSFVARDSLVATAH